MSTKPFPHDGCGGPTKRSASPPPDAWERAVDCCDSTVQKEILVQQYRAASSCPRPNFTSSSLCCLQRNYTTDAVVHQVIHGTAMTQHGINGVCNIWEKLGPNRLVEHVAIESNHAKMVWKMELWHRWPRRYTQSFGGDGLVDL